MNATCSITLQSQARSTQGKAELRQVSRQEAVRKGLVGMIGCWVVALFTLPIPLVHFVAPPILFLFGPLVGFFMFKLYNGAVDIISGEGPCPDCGAVVPLTAGAERWPQDVICPGCQARLTVTRS
jgi:hypothetical protein